MPTKKTEPLLTPKQQQVVDLYIDLGSERLVAEKLGVSKTTVHNQLKAAKNKLRADNHEGAPYGHVSGKRTVQLDGEGNLIQEWVRFHPKEAEVADAIVESLERRLKDKGPVIKKPRHKTKGRCLVIPIADPHFGLYCWREETGNDYDLKIAVALHTAAISRIMSKFDGLDEIVFLSIGDLTHSDSRQGKTEKSGHILDMDDRYFKVVDATTEFMTNIINMAAKKAKKVIVKMVPGNHDFHTTGHIARSLNIWYRRTKHIDICISPAKQKYHVFGKSLIGVAHGDTEKPDRLKDEMTLHPEWSATDTHVWYTGHIHTKQAMEFNNCEVESLRTLAGRNAYACEGLYRSRRAMVGILHDFEYGEVERQTCHVKQAEI